MRYKEFLEYLEINLSGYQAFMQKAIQYQEDKNLKRQAKSRWNDVRIQRAADDMWKKSMEALYNNLKREIDSESVSQWTTFIEKNGILETVNEGISDLSFSEDVA